MQTQQQQSEVAPTIPAETTETAAATTEPATTTEAAPATPQADPYDSAKLTLPEGFDKENETFKAFEGLAKEAGLSHKAAQTLIDQHTAAIKASTDALYADWYKQNETWQKEVKADAEIGGAKLDGVLQTVAKVLDNAELTDPKFREALEYTGAGNHPAVARTLYRWAKALSEGESVSGNPPARAANGALSNDRPSPGQSIYGPTGPHTGGPKLS
jgi:hypothetical protein